MTVTPQARTLIEQSIIEALGDKGTLGTKSLRACIKRNVKRPPVTDRRVARICSSLLKQGVIEREEVGRKSLWTLKQY